MSGQLWEVKDRHSAECFVDFVKDQQQAGRHITYSIKRETRSSKQNNALHLLCRQIEQDFRDHGVTRQHPFNPEIELPWTWEAIKNDLFKETARIMFKTDRTSDLDTAEFSQLVDAALAGIAKHTGRVFFMPTYEGEQ